MLVLEFTGERVVPGRVNADLWNEHLSRYLFATRVARDKQVIDLGCGAGYGTAELARTAKSVLGIDLATDAVEWARSQYGSENIRFEQASCDNAPVPDRSQDVAVSFEVIEHLEQPEKLLAEVRRILSPEGVFIVSTPNIDYYAETRDETGPNPYHHHEFSFDEFRETLGRYFAHITIYTQNHVPAVAFQSINGSSNSAPIVRMQKAATETDLTSANFFIAVCSQVESPTISSFFYLPSTGNVLREREKHISELEKYLEREKEEHAKAVAQYEKLEKELEAANEWAKSLDADVVRAREVIAHMENESITEQQKVAGILTARDAEFEERTQWALSLKSELEQQTHRVNAVLESRWYKLGKKFNFGPDIG